MARGGRNGNEPVYTPEIAAEICERLKAGESLNAICRADEMPSEYAVRAWALEDRDGFASKYARARELQYLKLADEIEELAASPVEFDGKPDGVLAQQLRIRVDARKWQLSKMLPKVFGDRQEIVGAGGKDLVPSAEIDNQKLALALVGLLQAAKKEGGE